MQVEGDRCPKKATGGGGRGKPVGRRVGDGWWRMGRRWHHVTNSLGSTLQLPKRWQRLALIEGALPCLRQHFAVVI